MNQDEIFSSFITLAIIWQVRRFLDTRNRIPQWDRMLQRFWIVNVSFVILSTAIDEDFPLRLIWLFALAAITYTVWLIKDNQSARTLLIALAPFMFFMAISKIIQDVFPHFAKAHDDFFESINGFALFWLIGFFIVANRQKKAQVKIDEERALEAEQRRVIEAKKQELEYLVAERTAEITRQKEELELALVELKSTQTQLIQSEKMASLGELTAGIAHEIQNPLNFVNNFSEVSIELIDELVDEQVKPHRDTELEAELLTDLKQNLQKINYHGGRASSIVKGMLQHSRTSTGQREPTDINSLCEEYLRLAYHGLRAKDKSFNALFSTDLDSSLGLVSLIPQDISRVLLNLFTNAFYAVQQRQKQGGPLGYHPTVIVSTRCVNKEAVITVADNGTGIADDVKQKIFQPFFTTKPTGEGTGLGLSLAYEIITKGHNGTLEVESKVGEGSKFIVTLPG
ncbi:ATP-binding protein [Spirosoma fluviale]